MSSESGEREESSLLWKGVLAAVFVISIFLVYKMWYADELRVHAWNGFCPENNRVQKREGVISPGHTVILIDTSDEISPEVAKAAFVEIDKLARDTLRVPFLQKISIYGLPESLAEIPKAKGEWCVPKPGKMANVLYENKRVVEFEFREFLRGVKTELDSLRDREEADQSPIVETMGYLVKKYGNTEDTDDDIDSFILISDMLQHTTLATHYDGDMALTPEARSECAKIRGGRLKSVWVYYVDRELDVQGNLWPTAWWVECLDGVEAETLDLVN